MGAIRKRGVSYEARYRDPEGKSRSRSFRTKAEARSFLSSTERDIHRGEWIDPERGRIPFGEFSQEWLETTVHLRPSTRASYQMLLRTHVLPYFEDAPLRAIDRTLVQQWLSRLQADGRGAGTIRNAYRIFARIMGEAERSRRIARNPATKIPLPKSHKEEMHFLEPPAIKRLADAVPPRYRALILVAGFVGLRWGELVALKVGHLDLLRGAIDVRESLSDVDGHIYVLPPKSGERRTVPLPRFLRDALDEHISAYARKDGLVFTSPDGEVLRRQNFSRRQFRPALRRAGLGESVRFHDLRHSAASIAINSGANVKQVQQMLGHSSAMVTLDTYSHVFPALSEQLRDSLDSAYRDAENDSSVGNLWDLDVARTSVRESEGGKHAR